MQNFDEYTPEMLVYYKNLSPALQNAVRSSDCTPDSLESLSALAEHIAMSGMLNGRWGEEGWL